MILKTKRLEIVGDIDLQGLSSEEDKLLQCMIESIMLYGDCRFSVKSQTLVSPTRAGSSSSCHHIPSAEHCI